VPKPFGPVLGGRDLFEEDLRSELLALGLTVSFLDDWYEYHVNLGEVHCATNTLRRPKAAQWKWWDFAP
jgi:protein-arginine deiminase